MRNIPEFDPEGLPTTASLVKGTLLACFVACILLVTTVLPAEYGIDPTGIGARLGLHGVSSTATADEEILSPADNSNLLSMTDNLLSATVGPVWKQQTPYRNDTDEVTLESNTGLEVKAVMQAGERLLFEWQVEGGVVNFDMHGEETGATDEFTSYWKGLGQSSASGYFEAPFDGTHGWYWENRGDTPVTVKLKTTGYYQKLFRP